MGVQTMATVRVEQAGGSSSSTAPPPSRSALGSGWESEDEVDLDRDGRDSDAGRASLLMKCRSGTKGVTKKPVRDPETEY